MLARLNFYMSTNLFQEKSSSAVQVTPPSSSIRLDKDLPQFALKNILAKPNVPNNLTAKYLRSQIQGRKQDENNPSSCQKYL